MSKRDKTKKELQLENEKLCVLPKKAEEALRTTRGEPVDTLIVSVELGDPVFTFEALNTLTASSSERYVTALRY